MLNRKPDYYDEFQCAAGDCPDTCCAAWDIVIDPDSAAFYRALPGALGDRVRAAMTVDEEGEPCFSVSGGRCPLLTGERLCAIQLELGETRVCETCRSHPRFIEEYGSFRELALAASCPAAIELILGRKGEPVTWEDGEPPFQCEDVDEALLAALLPCREAALALVGRADLPWPVRLAALPAFGAELQLALAQEGPSALPGLAEEWAALPGETLEAWTAVSGERRAVRRRCLALLGELEILEEAWRAETAGALTLLDGLDGPAYEAAVDEEKDGGQEVRWAAYLIRRWFLRADFDGDIYGKLALPVLSILALRELALARRLRTGACSPEDWRELARRWAKEIEHCAENLAALYDAASGDPALAPAALIAAARHT